MFKLDYGVQVVVVEGGGGSISVLTDSASLCNVALMRSGLRGGGSGGSDAAMVGPLFAIFICIIQVLINFR